MGIPVDQNVVYPAPNESDSHLRGCGFHVNEHGTAVGQHQTNRHARERENHALQDGYLHVSARM